MRYGYLPCVPWLSEGTPFLQSLPKASNQGRTGLKVQECKAGTAISRKLQEILKSEVIPVGKSLTRNGKKVGFSMKIDKSL